MRKSSIIGVIAIVVALVAGVSEVVLLMNGQTKTYGGNPANVEGKSLVCTSQTIAYPYFRYDNSNAKNLKVAISFYDDRINAISLSYVLYYDNSEQIVASEAHNHASMNISFAENGLRHDSFSAFYSKLSDSMKMGLYEVANNINLTSAKYFMVNTNEEDQLPATLFEYQQNYEALGFICSTEN